MPLMLKPRNVRGPPRKNWSMMLSLEPEITGLIIPTAMDPCNTYTPANIAPERPVDKINI